VSRAKWRRERYETPFTARVAQEGDGPRSVIAYGAMVHTGARGDGRPRGGPRSRCSTSARSCPLDEEAILASRPQSARRWSILDEANATCAAGAQVAALIAERGWEDLDGPVVRVATPDVPIPFSPTLEQAILPQVDDVREAVRELLSY
jgi:2-oxoisovalerate dehydrogenase E1 component beta subunit